MKLPTLTLKDISETERCKGTLLLGDDLPNGDVLAVDVLTVKSAAMDRSNLKLDYRFVLIRDSHVVAATETHRKTLLSTYTHEDDQGFIFNKATVRSLFSLGGGTAALHDLKPKDDFSAHLDLSVLNRLLKRALERQKQGQFSLEGEVRGLVGRDLAVDITDTNLDDVVSFKVIDDADGSPKSIILSCPITGYMTLDYSQHSTERNSATVSDMVVDNVDLDLTAQFRVDLTRRDPRVDLVDLVDSGSRMETNRDNYTCDSVFPQGIAYFMTANKISQAIIKRSDLHAELADIGELLVENRITRLQQMKQLDRLPDLYPARDLRIELTDKQEREHFTLIPAMNARSLASEANYLLQTAIKQAPNLDLARDTTQ